MLLAQWNIEGVSEIVGIISGILAIAGAAASCWRWFSAKKQLREVEQCRAASTINKPRLTTPALPVRAWLTLAIIPTIMATVMMFVLLIHGAMFPQPGQNRWAAFLMGLLGFLLFYGLRWFFVWRRLRTAELKSKDYTLWTVFQFITTFEYWYLIQIGLMIPRAVADPQELRVHVIGVAAMLVSLAGCWAANNLSRPQTVALADTE